MQATCSATSGCPPNAGTTATGDCLSVLISCAVVNWRRFCTMNKWLTFLNNARGLAFVALAMGLVSAPAFYRAQAQHTEAYKASLVIRSDQPKGIINRNIQGQFAEHLGRLIYGGLWVGEESPIPNTRGLRNDVVSALKELHIPVLR